MFYRVSTFFLVCLCATVALAGKVRTWTSTDGKTMEAEFVRELDGEVTFLKGGKLVVIKLERLSAKDQQAVKDLVAGKEPEEDPFTAPAPTEKPAAGSGENATETPPEKTFEKSDKPKKPIVIQTRTWTDRFGNKSSGKFVRVDGNDVVINRGTRVLTVAFGNLSDDDQEYVRNVLTSQGKEDAIPSASAPGAGGPVGAGGAGQAGMGVGPGRAGMGPSGPGPAGMMGAGPGRAGMGAGPGMAPVAPGTNLGGPMVGPAMGGIGGGAGGVPGVRPPGTNGPGAVGAMGPMGTLPPSAMGPGAMGPGAVGPGAVGPGAVGPGAMGPGAMGPGAMGPGAMGPGAMGPGAMGGMSTPSGMPTMGGMNGPGGMGAGGMAGMGPGMGPGGRSGMPSGMPGMGSMPGRMEPTSIPSSHGPTFPDIRMEEVYQCSKCNAQLSKLEAAGSTCPRCNTTWGYKQDEFGRKTMTTAGRGQIGSAAAIIVVFVILGLIVFVALLVGIIVAVVKAATASRSPQPLPQQRYY